eukprot:1191911-Prorocentrum_minimum.AAC.4
MNDMNPEAVLSYFEHVSEHEVHKSGDDWVRARFTGRLLITARETGPFGYTSKRQQTHYTSSYTSYRTGDTTVMLTRTYHTQTSRPARNARR